MKNKIILLMIIAMIGSGIQFLQSDTDLKDCDFGCNDFPDCRCIDEIQFRD